MPKSDDSTQKRIPTMEELPYSDGKPLDGELQADNPLWMSEIGLGIGTEVGNYRGITREWLYWYDEQGKRYPTPEEAERQAQLQRQQAVREARQQAERRQRQARQQAEERQDRAEREAQRERERAEQLAARLRELGIDPERLN